MTGRSFTSALLAAILCGLGACGADGPEAPEDAPSTNKQATLNTAEACLSSAQTNSDADRREAELACPMRVTEKVTIKFVGTDETYGCSPHVVGVAPKDSPREYVRVAIDHGDGKEYTGVIRLENKALPDRKSGWRTYGWPGNPPLDPCSDLPMKVVSITCKQSGEDDYTPCEDDVDLLRPGLFASEELLK